MRDFRERFRVRLLRNYPEKLAMGLVDRLEQAVASSQMGLAPSSAWVGPHTDTLVAFLDGKLVAALVIENAPMVGPLVVVDDLGAMPARLLDHLRIYAEGMLVARQFQSYYFPIGPGAPAGWTELVMKIGCNKLSADGIEVLERKI